MLHNRGRDLFQFFSVILQNVTDFKGVWGSLALLCYVIIGGGWVNPSIMLRYVTGYVTLSSCLRNIETKPYHVSE